MKSPNGLCCRSEIVRVARSTVGVKMWLRLHFPQTHKQLRRCHRLRPLTLRLCNCTGVQPCTNGGMSLAIGGWNFQLHVAYLFAVRPMLLHTQVGLFVIYVYIYNIWCLHRVKNLHYSSAFRYYERENMFLYLWRWYLYVWTPKCLSVFSSLKWRKLRAVQLCMCFAAP